MSMADDMSAYDSAYDPEAGEGGAGGYADAAWDDPSLWDAADDDDVRETAVAQLDAAIAWQDTQDLERKDNLDRWLGLPYGTERADYCKAVDRTAMETVGWILPALLEIFHGSDETGQFEPSAESDVDAAEQATDLVNYVYARDNPGFLVSATVLQDALIEGLGTWKVEWDDAEAVTVTTHTGLSMEQAQALVQQEGVELLAGRVRVEASPITAQSIEAMAQASGDPMLMQALLPPPRQVMDMRIRRRKKRDRVRVEAVPNSEYGYEPGARNAADANFHYHRRLMPRADLVALGYDDQVIADLQAEASGKLDPWRTHTETFSDAIAPSMQHESMELLAYYECYLRADCDGDGIAEWRKVCLAGTGKELLHQEMIDKPPFVPVSPILLSHHLEGLAVVDLVKDLQAIRTDILRLMVDGLFDTTVPRFKVLHSAKKQTWEALLSPATGRPIPVTTMDEVEAFQPPWSGAQALPLMEWLERQREQRTGVSTTSTGASPDLLQNQTAAAVNQLMTAAQQKIGLIARVMAETGYKPLFMRILELLVQHQDKPRTLRLRNRWVAMEPASWDASMDYVPNVGLGTGDKTKVRQALMDMLAIQREALQAGAPIATWKQVYNTLKELTRASNLPSVEPYFVDPSTEGQQQQPAGPPDPMADPAVAGLVAGEQVKADSALRRELIEDAYKRDKMWVDLAIEGIKSGFAPPWQDLLALVSQPPALMQAPPADAASGAAPIGMPSEMPQDAPQAPPMPNSTPMLGPMLGPTPAPLGGL
jgi:hypothetical protein